MQRSQFGPYRVIRLLAQGGMGTVYEALDPATGRTVAVKTLPLHLENNEAVQRRFQSEIKALMKLSNPGIARMLAWGEEDGLPFFAMEFVPGLTLEALLRSGRRFTWQETVAISLEIIRILKSAHDQGVVHRDLKPANLMFPPAAGGGFHVKLTDFGIAKLFGETGLTRSGMVVGTPEFMAPEQAAGNAVDHRADLYSLGLVMYAMLAGKAPFQGTMAEVLECQRSKRPPAIATLVPDIPQPLGELLEQLLEKSPGRRPANATVVARMLADITATPPPTPRKPTFAVPPVPPAGDTTVVTDAAGHEPPTAAATRTHAHGLQPARSSYTTVEEEARQKRVREAREARLKSWLATATALAIIASVLTAGWFGLKPVFFPNADIAHARIIAIAENPNKHRLEYPPCDKIEDFLSRFPDDPRSDGLRQIGREIGLDRLQKQLRRSVLKMKLGLPGKPVGEDARRSSYLEGLRLWIMVKDLEGAATQFRGIIKASGINGPPENASPCDVTEKPDPAAWRELARRQLMLVEAQLIQAQGAALANKKRAEAMLQQAAVLRNQIDDPHTHATERVVAVVQRHALLEQVEDTFADDPECAEQVKEAKRLLDADH